MMYDEDLADAVRDGSLVDCPYVRGLIHCDEDCNNCDAAFIPDSVLYVSSVNLS